jgi:hypothetical protein
MNTFKRLAWIAIFSTLLAGCAVETVKDLGGNYRFRAEARQGSHREAINKAYELANKKCESLGRGAEEIKSRPLEDYYGGAYEVDFHCYDLSVRAAQKRKIEEDAKREADRRNSIAAEQQRQADLQRQKDAAEWERGRPAREAQARRERAELEAKLRVVCPMYYAARQSCATAAHPNYCMNVRLSNNYSEWTDSQCRNR